MYQPSSTSNDPTNDSTVDHTLKLPTDLTPNSTNAPTSADGEKSVLQTVSASITPDLVSRSTPNHSHDLKIPALPDLSTSGVYSDETEAVTQPAVKEETHNGKCINYRESKIRTGQYQSYKNKYFQV